MKLGVFGRCGLLLVVVLFSGCRSDEDRCASLCEYLDECTTLDSDCTEDDLEDCAEDVDDISEPCEEAFDDFTDCVDDEENDCDGIREHCQGEASALFDECQGLM